MNSDKSTNFWSIKLTNGKIVLLEIKLSFLKKSVWAFSLTIEIHSKRKAYLVVSYESVPDVTVVGLNLTICNW